MNTLTFLTTGIVTGLYSEIIDLTCLGKMKIKRATNIEFDNRLQAWRVKDMSGFALYTSPSRQACLDWEQQYFNKD